MKKLSIIVAALLIVSVVLATGCGGGAPDAGAPADSGAPADTAAPADTGAPADDTAPAGGDSITIRMGAGTGADNPMMTFMERFQEYAERESGGRITVEIYPFGQLGTNAQNVQSVADGSVEMYMVPSNYWGALVPEINAITFPGLFDDSAHCIRGMEAEPNLYEEALNNVGITSLGWCFLNDYILAANKDLTDLDNLSGLKIWSNPGVAYEVWLQAMGATPSLVDVSEMVSGIQNGTLDGTCGGMSLFKPFNIQSVCDYLYVGPRNVGVFPVMANLAWVNGLPDDLREIVVEGSRIVCYEGFDNYNSIAEYGAEYQIEAIELARADGMTIIEPSAADWEKMLAVSDAVTAKALESNPAMQPYYDKLLPIAEATK